MNDLERLQYTCDPGEPNVWRPAPRQHEVSELRAERDRLAEQRRRLEQQVRRSAPDEDEVRAAGKARPVEHRPYCILSKSILLTPSSVQKCRIDTI